MDLGLLGGFLLVSLTLACTPGADWAYIISSALGKRSYHPAVWGLLSGYLFHTVLLVCGIAALVANSPTLLLWLTTAGSLYLLWLGIATLRSWKQAKFYDEKSAPTLEPKDPVPDPVLAPTIDGNRSTLMVTRNNTSTATTWRAPYFKGLLTSGTNPKALLLYVALIPQFLDATQPMSITAQTGILGLTHFFVSILVYFCVAFASRALLRSRPTAAQIVTMCSGIIMVLLSAVLIFEQIASLQS